MKPCSCGSPMLPLRAGVTHCPHCDRACKLGHLCTKCPNRWRK